MRNGSDGADGADVDAVVGKDLVVHAATVGSPLTGGSRIGPVTGLLSIGEFATVTHLSVKTLRHYHEAGLLTPERVDPHSGYRYYSADQIPTAQVIRRFRDLDMPVPRSGGCSPPTSATAAR